MALNIKDPETERLAAEVAALAGESKTRAVRIALAERRDRLQVTSGESELDRLLRFMQDEIWPQLEQRSEPGPAVHGHRHHVSRVLEAARQERALGLAVVDDEDALTHQ